MFRERQIYRIDHYLGKETVQNIMVFRFGNGIFEPIWNRRYVDNVQVSVAETVGVEGRGAYYEESGALRDMVQNHLMQVLALVAMEPVASFQGDAVRDEKAKVFHAITPIENIERDTVRGQYVGGRDRRRAGAGLPRRRRAWRRTRAPRRTPRCGSRSRTGAGPACRSTSASGKRLPKRATEVAITFKTAPLQLFRQMGGDNPTPNLLVLRIQPDEGISLRFGAKVPGTRSDVRPVNMDFRYGTSFGVDAAGGVRTAAARRDARRLDAVHALGRRRGRVGSADAGARCVGRGRVAAAVLRGRQLGAGRGHRA